MDYCGAFLHQFFEAFSKYCRLYTQDLTQSRGIRQSEAKVRWDSTEFWHFCILKIEKNVFYLLWVA